MNDLKAPASVRAENLAPWHWKKERAPKLYNPGPAPQASVNSVQLGPLLEDAKPSIAVSSDCLESDQDAFAPVAVGTVLPSREVRLLEDGK